MEEMNNTLPGGEVTEEMTTDTESFEMEQDTQTETMDTEETQEQTEQKPFNFELQYNKEKVVIDSEDKLRELAQKGMNYDKIYQRTDELNRQLQETQNNPLLKWASDYMKSFGYTDPNDFLHAIEIQNKVTELMDNHGFTEEQAKRIAEAESKAAKVEQRLNEKEAKENQNKDYSDFLAWHDKLHKDGVFAEPLDPYKIPTEVWQEVENGTPLKVAYMEYSLKNVKVNTEQEVIKNMKKNADTSPGSVKENTASEDKPWSAEYIEAMAEKYGQGWVMKNYDKIEKSGYYK